MTAAMKRGRISGKCKSLGDTEGVCVEEWVGVTDGLGVSVLVADGAAEIELDTVSDGDLELVGVELYVFVNDGVSDTDLVADCAEAPKGRLSNAATSVSAAHIRRPIGENRVIFSAFTNKA